MRILIASGIFHPEPGGPATYLYHLLPRLQLLGHSPIVLSFGNSTQADYPYPVIRIPRRNYLRRQWDYIRAASRLWPSCDVAYIHSLGLPLPSSLRPRIAKIVGDVAWERAVNKGWIPPAADIDTFQFARYAPQVEINKALRAREACQLDAVIVPSEYLKRMVTGWGVHPERIRVIYNALESETPAPEENQATARLNLDLPDAPILFAPARLTAWKGIDHCIRALSMCSHHDAYFVIAGEGPMRASLEGLAAQLGIANRVIFVGRIPSEQMPLYFRAADYTVLYSGYEGLSHTLLESLRVGTPLIASDKGGNPEVVQHDSNGLLVPYINLDALTSTFDHALSPGIRASLAAHACLDERFSMNRMVQHTEAALKEVAGV